MNKVWMTGVGLAVILTSWSVTTCAGEERSKTVILAKQMCRDYMEGYFHPSTNLVYGKRINGRKGIDVLEPPESIAKEQYRGKYKPYGYGAGIEDTAYQDGIFLFALCEAYETTGDTYFAGLAKKVFKGMKLIGSISPVSGFVVRGPHPDGKSYYRDSSLDQHSLYVCGMWRYYRSPISSKQEKAFIRDVLDKIARRLETNGWKNLVEDNSRVAHAGGGNWAGKGQSASLLLLSVLGAVQDVTGGHWRQVYRKFADEDGGIRWKKIGQGHSDRLPRYTLFSNQAAFRASTLMRVGKDPARKEVVRSWLAGTARDMLTCNFFTHWRRLDWIGEDPTEEDVDAFLKPLGLTAKSTATIFDLWDAYRPGLKPAILPSSGRRRYHSGICLMAPVMVWNIALLSDDAALTKKVTPSLLQMRAKVDFSRLSSGFTMNYAVVCSLLAAAGEGSK